MDILILLMDTEDCQELLVVCHHHLLVLLVVIWQQWQEEENLSKEMVVLYYPHQQQQISQRQLESCRNMLQRPACWLDFQEQEESCLQLTTSILWLGHNIVIHYYLDYLVLVLWLLLEHQIPTNLRLFIPYLLDFQHNDKN